MNRKPKVSKENLQTAKRLLKYVTGTYKVRFVIVFICILLSSIASISVSLSLKFLIDDFISPLIGQKDPNFAELYRALAVLGSIFLMGVIATFTYTRLMVYIGQGVLKKVRDDMFEHMQTLPIRYFDQNTNGSIMSLYTNDTDTLRQMISQSIPQALMSFFTIIVTFISMLILSPLLTILAVLIIGLMIFVTKKIGGNSGKYFVRQQKSLADVTGFVEERMNGQRVVKVFNHERKSEEEFDKLNEVLRDRKLPVRFVPGCEILTEEERRLWQADNCRIQGEEEQNKEMSGSCGDQYADLEEIGPEDTVVLVLGEHEAQSGEAASRAFLDLPEGQQKFFDAVAERTSHIVAVIMSGRPLDIRKIAEKSQAVLLAWRPGTMGAEAVVRLVYGEETPSGKLSVSIPWGVGQVPVSYWDVKTGHRMTETNPENRFTSRYMDIPNEPLYPFGFGLSYTGFTITPPVLEKQEREDKIGILCKVKNVGEVPGAEVVQCYVETLCAPVVRPAKELIRFRKVFLQPGEEQKVKFTIDRKELAFYGADMELIDGGIPLRITVGNSSRAEAGDVSLQLDRRS